MIGKVNNMNFEKVEIECLSGDKVNERPVAFIYQGRRREISEILDRWYEGGLDAGHPKIDYFKVRTSDGRVFLLRYLFLFDSWTICI